MCRFSFTSTRSIIPGTTLSLEWSKKSNRIKIIANCFTILRSSQRETKSEYYEHISVVRTDFEILTKWMVQLPIWVLSEVSCIVSFQLQNLLNKDWGHSTVGDQFGLNHILVSYCSSKRKTLFLLYIIITTRNYLSNPHFEFHRLFQVRISCIIHLSRTCNFKFPFMSFHSYCL